jgi:phthalate 4,5-cis-dihydrodiol dehydrogenase
METTITRHMRLGLAGLGVGSSMFLRAVDVFPDARAVAAADVRASARDAFAQRYGGRTYESVAALCADPEVDVVWVATPNQYHCEHVVLAAEHGKHIICTKPMALTVAECERMCAAAERNGVQLLCGQTYAMSRDIQAMHAVVQSGELGRLIAVNCWLSTDWLLKPRVAEELDESLGGGVVYRHGPHLIDTVRLLGGGNVRSVRAQVGRWMPERPSPGNFTAYLEFADGTPATIVYNGYGYFDTSELTWGIGNRMYSDEERIGVRRALRSGTVDNEAAKEGMRFGAGASDPTSRGSVQSDGQSNAWFGITVASCERGDIRQSPHGIYVYGDDGRRELPVSSEPYGLADVREMHAFLTKGTPITHDGRWATATLEIGTAIVQSARERREVLLQHQAGAR